LLIQIIKFNFKEALDMKKTLVGVSVVAVLFFGLTQVFAYGPGAGRCCRGGAGQEGWEPGKSQGPDRWASLTPEQKTKLQEQRRKFNDETAQLKGSIVTKRLELQSLWSNPKSESKAIQDKEKELRDLQNQMRDKMVQFRLELRSTLTPEQLAEFGPGPGMGKGFGRGSKGGPMGGPMMGHGPRMGRGYGSCY